MIFLLSSLKRTYAEKRRLRASSLFLIIRSSLFLFKRKEENGEVSYSNMLTKSGVTILNKMDTLPIESRNINYQYYISEAKKIIADFIYQQLELF